MQDAGSLTQATTRERRAVRICCEAEHLDFCKLFSRETWGEPFLTGLHHQVIAEFLDKVISGEITRGIINIPPGFSKTREVVVFFIARCIAMFPDARFIHASFSDMLVKNNSGEVLDIMRQAAYQALWPRELRADISQKGLWRTTQQGGLLAKPAGGPITGFRAGRMDKSRFTGGLLIDDPLKPDDAFSKTYREQINRNFNTTLRNRLAHPGVPIIVIMQRLHQDDLCGFLLKGGSGDVWDHLELGVEIDNLMDYPPEWTHGRQYDHGLPDGLLWEHKVDAVEHEKLKKAEYVYWSQYRQRPQIAGGNVFKRPLTYWERESDIPNLMYRVIYGDTAQKTEEANDYSVFQCWGLGVNGKAYLLDQLRGKWKAPDLKLNAETFWAKHRREPDTTRWGHLRVMKVEDKSSGTGLIQSLKGVPVEGIPREKDKYTRGLDAAPAFNSGLVMLPKAAPWLLDYELELLAFPNGDYDDQVDPTMDAIADMVGAGLELLDML